MRAVLFFVFVSSFPRTWAFFSNPPPRNYYAFGDSWPAGFPKAGEPIDHPVLSHCSQHSKAYPALFAAEAKITMPNFQYQSFACDGPGPGTSLTEIATHILQHLPEDANIISIQGGLIDIAFPSMLHACDESPSVSCAQRLRWSERKVFWELPAKSFYRKMLLVVQAARTQAPNALIVLLGYPRFYGNPLSSCFPSREKEYTYPFSIVPNILSVVVKGRINDDVLLRMNRITKKIAGRKEFQGKVVFKDPDGDFTHHHYCEYLPWLEPYNWSAGRDEEQFTKYGYYHPTEAGHQVFKRLLTEAWRDHGPKDPGKCMSEGSCEL